MTRFLRRSLRASSVLFLSATLFGFGTALAVADGPALRPLDGASLTVGSKRVVGYYVTEGQACKVTLLVGDGMVNDVIPATTAARVSQTILPNATARIDTMESQSLELGCQPGGAGLSIRVLNKVAAFKAAE